MIELHKNNKFVAILGVLICLVGMSACSKPAMIGKTEIPNTKLNRKILRVIALYRKAMVDKDTAKILALVHPSYQDNAGTPDPKDDIDHKGLEKLLFGRFQNVEKINYRIEFQRLKVKGRRAIVDAWMDTTFIYKQKDYRPHYKHHADYVRYHLLEEKGEWRFIKGL